MRRDDIFEKINKYLYKQGHEIVMSLFLDGYNGNQIYVRMDYVAKLSIYKIVWFDLRFIDIKHLDKYINMQMMTKYMAESLINKMLNSKYESGFIQNPNIIGDRVEIISYVTEDRYEFVFDRFLPLEWKFLIDPLVIMFSYLPRGMECILNEMFGKFDGLEEKYNMVKFFKFDLLKDDLNKLFKKSVLEYAQVLVDDEMVSFLEKVNNKYLGIVEGKSPQGVSIDVSKDGYIRVNCDCKDNKYCVHLAAVILAIRQKKKCNTFYKVKLIRDNESLLDKLSNVSYFLCFGLVEDRLLLINEVGFIFEEPILADGKVQFEVLEDDDEMSLSKVIEGYNK